MTTDPTRAVTTVVTKKKLKKKKKALSVLITDGAPPVVLGDDAPIVSPPSSSFVYNSNNSNNSNTNINNSNNRLPSSTAPTAIVTASASSDTSSSFGTHASGFLHRGPSSPPASNEAPPKPNAFTSPSRSASANPALSGISMWNANAVVPSSNNNGEQGDEHQHRGHTRNHKKATTTASAHREIPKTQSQPQQIKAKSPQKTSSSSYEGKEQQLSKVPSLVVAPMVDHPHHHHHHHRDPKQILVTKLHKAIREAIKQQVIFTNENSGPGSIAAELISCLADILSHRLRNINTSKLYSSLRCSLVVCRG